MIIERITEITSDSNMKIILISIFCALARDAVGGAIGWPGAIPLSTSVLKTISPAETKVDAYSTSQYINALPPSYSYGVHPQFVYHVPQANSYAPLSTGYYSVGNPSYVPVTNIFYPGHAFVPGFGTAPGASVVPIYPSAPSFPSVSAPTNPAFPAVPSNEQPAKPDDDADTAVVDSAEFAAEQRKNYGPGSLASIPSQPAEPQPSGPNPAFPSSNNFPTNPEKPQELGHGATHPPPPPPNNNGPSFSPHTPTPQIPHGSPSKPQPSHPEPAFPHFHPSNPNLNLPAIPQILQESEHVPAPPFATQFPQHNQGPSLATQTQIPQAPVQSPTNFPQIPQNPQLFAPAFPQYPQIPQNSGIPQNPIPQDSFQGPTSFPAPANDGFGLNDEDTISVESA